MLKLTDYLEKWARSDPERPLFTFLNRAGNPAASYTYASFHQRTNGLARVLANEIGVIAGEPILLVYPPGLEMITAFMACVKAGAIPVPVPPPAASAFALAGQRLSLISANSGAKRVLTDKAYLSAHGSLYEAADASSMAIRHAHLHSMDWIATNGLGDPIEHFERPGQELLFLQYTSGSTQAPRGVMVSNENVIANCLATTDHRAIGVSWLPHFHDMGLIGYFLFPLILGGSAFHFSPIDFLRRPLLWLETISRFDATVTSAPNFAFEYCLQRNKIPDDSIQALRLGSLRTMMNASEPVRPETMERFFARFAGAGLSRKALSASYGLAENTLCATKGGRVHVHVNKRLLALNKLRVIQGRPKGRGFIRVASCGKPLAGVDIRIVEPKSRKDAAQGEVGEIWLAGRSRALGYWKQLELSKELFQARLNGDASGPEYLRTGDIGFIHDGELYVCGRLRDLIIVRGVNVHPTDVEALVVRTLALDEHVKVAVFGFGKAGENDKGLVVLMESRPGDGLPDLRALHQEIRAHLNAPILALASVPRRSLASTSSGKISRHRCRDLWHRGAMQVIDRFDPAPQDTGASNLVEYIEGLLGQTGAASELTLGEVGLDSVDLVTLSLEIERFLKEKVGVGSLSDEAFDLRALQSLKIGKLKQIAEDIDAGRSSVHSLTMFYRQTARSVVERDAIRMRADSVLPAEIRPRRESETRLGLGAGAVLLTGATGFLGSHLLEALLRVSDRRVVVIARGQDAEHARQRVASALARAKGAERSSLGELGPRIEVLNGDIAAPCLGLPKHDWGALADRLSAVIHCGAEVDYVKTYAEVRGPNVSSTEEILKLCCAGAPKVLHHISSTFVFGWATEPRVFENDGNANMRGLDFGYTQSKWVAEQLIEEASERGLDARIYRPSLVTASRHGQYVREDILVRLLSYMIRHGLSVDAANQLSLMPVDVCAQNIVALAMLKKSRARIFHITTDRYYTMQMACQSITERFGYEFEYIDIHTFVDHMSRFCGPDDALFPLVAFFRTNSHKLDSMREKRYDNRNYRATRAKPGHFVPEPDLANTMEWVVEFLLRENLVPPFGDLSVPRIRFTPASGVGLGGIEQG